MGGDSAWNGREEEAEAGRRGDLTGRGAAGLCVGEEGCGWRRSGQEGAQGYLLVSVKQTTARMCSSAAPETAGMGKGHRQVLRLPLSSMIPEELCHILGTHQNLDWVSHLGYQSRSCP